MRMQFLPIMVLVAGLLGGVTASAEEYGTTVYTLWAGQTNNVGTVTIANDETYLYVTYALSQAAIDDGCELGKVHLWAGTNLDLVPANSQGILIPGQFPYQADTMGATSYTFQYELADVAVDVPLECGLKLYVVAHAEVICDDGTEVTTETAFGGGTSGSGPRWWYYMEYTLACGGDTEGTLETAFAKGGYVFTTGRKSNPENLPSLSLTQNRWGWAINLKTQGTTTYDIWAGAGLNKTSNGTLVGTLTVEWDGTDVTVTYDMDAGYEMAEVHVYAGDTQPTTVAPGQFGWTEYFDPYETSYSKTFEDVTDTGSDGIWVIAHAVVYVPTS